MQIEEGKFYRTRDGRMIGPMRRTIHGSDANFNSWATGTGASAQTYGSNGRWMAIGEDPWDIVAEWTDTTAAVLAQRPAIPEDVRQAVAKAISGAPFATARSLSKADAALAAIQAAGYPFDLTPFERRVLAERRRQQTVEGWTPEHDDEHGKGELAKAAACYAWASPIPTVDREVLDTFDGVRGLREWFQTAVLRRLWPWSPEWWKPTTPSRDLEKAGALILAEGDRLDRAAEKGGDA